MGKLSLLDSFCFFGSLLEPWFFLELRKYLPFDLLKVELGVLVCDFYSNRKPSFNER